MKNKTCRIIFGLTLGLLWVSLLTNDSATKKNLHSLNCLSKVALKGNAGEDTVVTYTACRKCWPAPITGEGEGVNCDSKLFESNKPLCEIAMPGQPDKAGQRANRIELIHSGCLSFIKSFANTKQMTTMTKGPQMEAIHSLGIHSSVITCGVAA